MPKNNMTIEYSILRTFDFSERTRPERFTEAILPYFLHTRHLVCSVPMTRQASKSCVYDFTLDQLESFTSAQTYEIGIIVAAYRHLKTMLGYV